MSDSEMTYDPAPVVIDTKAEVAPEAQMYEEEIAAPATVETAPFFNDQVDQVDVKQETTISQKIEEEVEAPEPIEPAQPKKYTANDVFGDDDDDSDLSSEDDEDDGPKPSKSRPRSMTPDDAGSSDSDEEGGDDYDPSGMSSNKKRRFTAIDEDDIDEERDRERNDRVASAPKRKPKGERKKRAKKEPETQSRETRVNSDGEEVEEQMDEKTATRRRIDAKFEALGKSGAKRRIKKRGDEGDDLAQDKEIEKITERMRAAVIADVRLNESGRPAIQKTLLLPSVMQIMQNASLQENLLENTDFLSAVTNYIEPLKDGALPSLTIQKSILGQLSKFELIDKDVLKSSGLGKIVNFYTRTKRVQPEITRQANLLIDKWSKPILRAAGLTAGTATGRMAATGHAENEEYPTGRGSGVITLNASDIKTKSNLADLALATEQGSKEEGKGKRPSTIGYSYTKAPPSRRLNRSAAEQDKEDARQRQLDLQASFRRKAMMGTR